MPAFKDHFSRQSEAYSRHRPGYPDELIEFVVASSPDREFAIDCATGNGQAALQIAPYFAVVLGIDGLTAAAGAAGSLGFSVAAGCSAATARGFSVLLGSALAVVPSLFESMAYALMNTAKIATALSAITARLPRSGPRVSSSIMSEKSMATGRAVLLPEESSGGG